MAYEIDDDILEKLQENKLKRLTFYVESKSEFEQLCEILKTNTSLRYLELNYGRSKLWGIEKLTTALQHNKTLSSLNLSNSTIPQEELELLANFIKDNNTLSQLNLSRTNVDEKGIEILANALQNNTKLSSLNLASTNLSSRAIELIAGLNTLTQLNLKNNKIDDVKIQALAAAVEKRYKPLSSLMLSDNQIGDLGIEALSPLISKNKILNKLDLWNNHISNQGAMSLATAIQSNPKLVALDVSMNNITDLGTKAIIDALEHNTSLLDISISFGVNEKTISPELSCYVNRNRYHLLNNDPAKLTAFSYFQYQTLSQNKRHILSKLKEYPKQNQENIDNQAHARILYNITYLDDFYEKSNPLYRMAIGNNFNEAMLPKEITKYILSYTKITDFLRPDDSLLEAYNRHKSSSPQALENKWQNSIATEKKQDSMNRAL